MDTGKATSSAPQRGTGFRVLMEHQSPERLGPLPFWGAVDGAPRALSALHTTAPAVDSEAALGSPRTKRKRGREERAPGPAPCASSLYKGQTCHQLTPHKPGWLAAAEGQEETALPFPKRRGYCNSGKSRQNCRERSPWNKLCRLKECPDVRRLGLHCSLSVFLFHHRPLILGHKITSSLIMREKAQP